MTATMRAVLALTLLSTLDAYAWKGRWAPTVDASPCAYREIPEKSVYNYVNAGWKEDGEEECFRAHYAKGAALDLNGDKFIDFVFLVPWVGNGLNADCCDIAFIVSDGKGGRMESVMQGWGAELSDLVTIGGQTYFRLSYFFEHFEKSAHNHWVNQFFAFNKDGTVRCANAEVGKAVGQSFPAVTIYYDDPKFKQIELTAADLKKIAKETAPVTKKYVP